MNPNRATARTRYVLRIGTRELEFASAEARYDAYVRQVRAGATDVEAFDLTPRYGRLDIDTVTIIF